MANTKVSANKKPSKRKPPAHAWKPGQSGNPKGAPKRGESWAEIIKRVGDMTPVEAATHSLELGKQLLNYGNSITLKEAVVMRVYGALLFEPTGGLFSALTNRAEGMPNQSLNVNSQDNKTIQIVAVDYRSSLAQLAPPDESIILTTFESRPMADLPTPGEAEVSCDGPKVGENHNGR